MCFPLPGPSFPSNVIHGSAANVVEAATASKTIASQRWPAEERADGKHAGLRLVSVASIFEKSVTQCIGNAMYSLTEAEFLRVGLSTTLCRCSILRQYGDPHAIPRRRPGRI